jgi:adenylate cyclase
MFTDLADFSALSERLPAQTLLRQVSAYHGLVSEVVESQSGTVDKFIGDGAMAFWGAPSGVPDHAWHACVAALRIQQGMGALNRQWAAEGLEPLRVRIGIHCDAVLVGNIGSAERMSYTVLGDGVNVAAYMEAANKAFGTSICISQTVVREAGQRLCTRPLDQVSVKTRQAAILVHELLGVHDGLPELLPAPDALLLAQRTAQAWKLRAEGQTVMAREAYRQVLAIEPQDVPAQRMLTALSAS